MAYRRHNYLLDKIPCRNVLMSYRSYGNNYQLEDAARPGKLASLLSL